MSWIRYGFYCLLVTFLLVMAGCGWGKFGSGKPAAKGEVGRVVDVNQEPEQIKGLGSEPFTISNKQGVFKVTPMAEYRIAAMIVGCKEYSGDWRSSLSPMDLALAWGGLADKEYPKYIEYEQRDRWYYYRYTQDSPFDHTYITSHSSNNHIIPATENLKKVLAQLAVKQTVLLEGYLVNVDGSYDGKKVWWHTSLVRTDSGDGACEIIYVRKMTVNGQVYE